MASVVREPRPNLTSCGAEEEHEQECQVGYVKKLKTNIFRKYMYQ
jgi:hypothetical protein